MGMIFTKGYVCFVCGQAEVASLVEEMVTAKVKEALADEPGEIFCSCFC